MNWTHRETPGEDIVCEAHNLLRIDDQYMVANQSGFTYWACDLATRVNTDMGVFRGSQSVYKVTAETDLIKGRGHLKELAMALEYAMDDCTFSGPVYDGENDTFRLYAAVYATGDDVGWLKRTFAAAVATQISEAMAMSKRFQSEFHAVPATSGHPSTGLRPHADEMLTHSENLFHPSGDGPGKWLEDPAWERAGWVMEREAQQFTSDGRSFLEADYEWPCGEGSIHLHVRADEPHRALGNGLHATLTMPMRLSPQAIGHLVLDLNSFERNEYRRCHTLGSWCMHDGRLAYRTFLPNALHAEGSLEGLCVTFSTRAIWVAEYFQERMMEAQASTKGNN
ncbi:MAG: hypothetical protein AB7T05_05280 [Fimbriimonadaceae bacterium]